MQKNIPVLVNHCHRGESALFKKRCVAFFIFSCMLINGFVSNASVNRYSFTMMLVSISKNASIQLLNKCSGSMRDISSKVCIDIMNMILPSKGKAEAADNSKEENKRENGAGSDYAVIVSNTYKRVQAYDSGDKFLYSASLYKTIFNGYDRYVFYEGAGKLIMILFLIFIASIVRRKGREILETISIGKLIGQKKISA